MSGAYLIHHGILGQRWGVRRYQNKDGTLTEAGKRRVRKDNDKIYSSLSDKERDYRYGSKNAPKKLDPFIDDTQDEVHRTFITYNERGKPASSLDLQTYKDFAAVAIMTDPRERGKGYAQRSIDAGMKWMEENGINNVIWDVDAENSASVNLAIKNGFQIIQRELAWSDEKSDWVPEHYRLMKILSDKSFGTAVSSVTSKLSNHPHPIAKQPLNVDEVMSRGNVSKKEAAECSRLADKVYARASKNEPEITKDIVGSVSQSGAKMYGLQYRLKQPTSIAGKIASDSKEDGVSFVESSRGIKDSVRYTAVSSNDNFVRNYKSIKSNLESKGYEETRCKNFFVKYQNGEVQHKAVQCTYKSPKGFIFEVQFQTPESQAAKDLKVPLYEERRRRGITNERAAELETQMRTLAEQVPYPNDISEIKSH